MVVVGSVLSGDFSEVAADLDKGAMSRKGMVVTYLPWSFGGIAPNPAVLRVVRFLTSGFTIYCNYALTFGDANFKKQKQKQLIPSVSKYLTNSSQVALSIVAFSGRLAFPVSDKTCVCGGCRWWWG